MVLRVQKMAGLKLSSRSFREKKIQKFSLGLYYQKLALTAQSKIGKWPFWPIWPKSCTEMDFFTKNRFSRFFEEISTYIVGDL